ncbi:uncharacterized protein PGTG_09553 [Puccinia graminis f. sp. tritici CRL 75-36-700-3]|uniref:CCHC-type domain-containing protein n=1 Tax=Puccinia graminis f. sp. tritici (strain CRL 75-36-700-3 / race SCCL) TaxID=418459 RepID=E3KHR5_PUCGT|nr:uncharacterized protein PGTG_09553 [Puccinia graminis f. sp. tritici CRL 75-36-700-3]EFP83840.1 hypothetical protein PGTG_09553 [Puccinia graminis f. sp. tritici CRL 75-36-700-3]
MAPLISRSPVGTRSTTSNVTTRPATSTAAGKRVARSPSPPGDDGVGDSNGNQGSSGGGANRGGTPPPLRDPAPHFFRDAPHPPHPADDPRTRAMIINAASNQFRDEYKLREDGSNFRDWLREIRELALLCFNREDWYDADRSHDRFDILAKSALLISVCRPIKADLYDVGSSHAIMQQLRRRFTTFSRAAQLNKWIDLFKVPCDKNSEPSSIATLYRHRLADLRDAGVCITADSILSIILHCSIAHGTKLRHEFDMAIDRELSVDQDDPLSFNNHIDILTACREKVRARESDRHRNPLPSGFSAGFHQSQPPARSASVESHPDNVYVLAGRPANFKSPAPGTTRTCFRCGATGHLISNCTAPPTFPAAHRDFHGVPPPPPPPGLMGPQYQAYYPILAPPFPPFPPFLPPPPPPAPAPLRPADSYRPVYKQPSGLGNRPAAREAEAGSEEPAPAGHVFDTNPDMQPSFSDLSFTGTDTRPETLFDTGATHHLTGDSERDPDFSWAQLNSYPS